MKIEGLLGLAQRAGQIVSGEDGVIKSIRQGKAAMALMDSETGVNTSKRITDACGHHGVNLQILPAGVLSAAIGKPSRMVAAVQKGTLAASLSAALNDIG